MLLRRKSLRSIIANSNLHGPPPPPRTTSRPSWYRLPFLGRSSMLFAKEPRRLNYNIGFYPLTTICSLSNLKDPIPTLDQPGVYKLSCGSCSAVYFGQSGRSLHTCLKEHKNDYINLHEGTAKKKISDLSAMALHFHQENHPFDLVTSKCIEKEKVEFLIIWSRSKS